MAAVTAFVASSLVVAAASRAAGLVLGAAVAGEGGSRSMFSVAAGERVAPVTVVRAMVYAPELVARAIATMMIGIALAALLADVARMCALCAYSGSKTPVWHGLARVPVLITVRAIELTVSFMLIAGGAMVVMRLPAMSPLHAALAGTAVMGPVLGLVALNFAAARVAIALAVRRLRPAPSLIHGYDVALRRLPSLLGLLARVVVHALPLWVAAGALTALAMDISPRAAVLLRAAGAACLGVAVLWAYASLVAWVGRDARLAGG